MQATTEISSEADHAADAILSDSVKFLPSPAEIRAACEEIQREWSEETRRSRCVVKNPEAITLPVRIGR